ncbi:MAG: aldehyde dehydrogenase family protein [Actinobacteria bacterium]|nr:aldehyde dehydrogenase family protein [Actinomycetota bacterium]
MPSTPDSRAGWASYARALIIRDHAFIDGAFQRAADAGTFPSINPADGTVIADIAACGPADVDHAVAAARRSFEAGSWSRATPAARRKVLLRLAALIEQHAEELALLDSMDMGKPVTVAHTMDVPGAAAVFAFYAEAIDKTYGELAPNGSGAHAFVTRVPLGVIAAITAWNYPLETASWKLAPALAAGNSVVLKPSERAPLSALLLAELATEAGLPAGVLNVVPGLGGTAGAALARHPDVDALAFTGSTAVGKQLLVDAGQSNMKKVSLECGGKSPNIVFADVRDLDSCAARACDAIFFNQGEVCSANSRLLVQREIAEQFLAAVAAHATRIAVGHPLEPATGMGPLVDSDHANRVEKFVSEVPRTAIVCGGNRLEIEGSDRYFQPTIARVGPQTGLDRRARIVTDEVFGPVLVAQLFDSEDDAVRSANDTPYGLAASVWTADLDRALRVSERLVAGTVSVNTTDAIAPNTPFGGFRMSGYSSDLSLHALDNYTGRKTTWISYHA